MIKIRRAELTDLAKIVQLENLSFQTDCFSKRRFCYLLTKAKALNFVVEKNQQLCAYLICLIRLKQLRIYSLAVHPKYKRNGIGHLLLQYVEAQARKRQFKKISLEVRQDNLAAVCFYRKHQFNIISECMHYYEDGATALRMQKIL